MRLEHTENVCFCVLLKNSGFCTLFTSTFFKKKKKTLKLDSMALFTHLKRVFSIFSFQ